MPVMATTPHALLADAAAVAAGGVRAVGDGAALRVGVDLGTASCVLVVLDDDRPVWVGAQPSGALRDGVVVDFARATGTVRALKAAAEAALGVFRDGELVALDDRAGGGHHLDLVLAGALGIALEDAEPYKRSHPAEAFGVLVPGLQRVAENVRALTVGAEDLPLHLAGGALMLPGADDVLATRLERTVVTYPHALLITPLGIARSA